MTLKMALRVILSAVDHATVLERMQMVKLSKRAFSATGTHNSVYSKSYVDPNPDPKYYADNPPDLNDEYALADFKAAPSSQTYSTFYDSTLLKFEKHLCKQGNSATARRIIRGALEHIKLVQVKKYHKASEEEQRLIEVNPLAVFHTALENAKPLLSLKRVTRGSTTYQVPTTMPLSQQVFFVSRAMRGHVWSGKPNTDAAVRLGNEILAAYRNEGAAVQAKQELHKRAHANRAYANFR